MKKKLLALIVFPALSPAADMMLASNMQKLPEDFKRYFYGSEIIVQVYLNDSRLYDAAVSLRENGDVQLIRTLDLNGGGEVEPETAALWTDILRQGVSVGKCVKNCPSGLMAVEYRLDNSVLKLYTSEYETARTRSAYVSLPDDTPPGMIMFNDVSVTSAAHTRSWGLNSSLTGSLGGWTQKASFQTSGTDGAYGYNHSSLYELFSQKELQGSFVRLGFFTPDSDTGNVQTSGFGYNTVVGAMWGTADTLLTNRDSVSIWPVYVTGSNQSIAEVWRDGRLIHTQQLEAGVQALDTRQLPGGIYDITVKIIDGGRMVDTQQAQIYKPQGWSNPDRRWRMNLWGGQYRTLTTGNDRFREENPSAAGGSIDVLAHPRAMVGFSGAATEKEHQVRVRANIMLSSDDALFAQYTQGETGYLSSQSTDILYNRNIRGGSAAGLFWRTTTTDVFGHKTRSRNQGDTWGGSLSLRLPWSTSLIVNGQYIDTAWRKGPAFDASLTTQATLGGRDANFRISAYDRPGFNDRRRDQGVSFGISLSLTPAARHSVSAETGVNQNQEYSSLSYQWQPGDDSNIRALGGGVSYSSQNTVLSGNASLDTPYISGDGYVQHSTHTGTNTAGGNLSQVLVMGGGRMASVSGNNSRSMESAMIVDVDSDDDTVGVVASGSMADTRLKPGRNIVPTEPWKKSTIQFAASGGESVQLFPASDTALTGRGGVKYVRVKAVKTYTLVGRLKDGHGNLLKNRYVTSDVTGGVVNAEGVLTLDSGMANRQLTVRAEDGLPAMLCALPAGTDRDKKVRFISEIECRPEGAGENK